MPASVPAARDRPPANCGACARGRGGGARARAPPPIEEARAAELQAQLAPAWERDGVQRLRCERSFRNFRDAFGFTAKLALLAESEGHHPDLELGWGRVAVTLTTHAAGGLTDNDFILAAKVDRL